MIMWICILDLLLRNRNRLGITVIFFQCVIKYAIREVDREKLTILLVYIEINSHSL